MRQVGGDAAAHLPEVEEKIVAIQRELKQRYALDDKVIQRNLYAIALRQREALQNAGGSPYFSRCDLHEKKGKDTSWYFGKFAIPELGIYSWVSPAARMRFEKPGPVAYVSESGREVRHELVRVDQYLISRGRINFMATESENFARTLVYQEHFSNRKSSFMLPEIVERMEKAQDEVIRAGHRGSFLISGPAGSGKTTLALHRIAYLVQAPETAAHFASEPVLVLVQDDSTKRYFDKLLPSLGIKEVGITTFAAWAKEILELPAVTFARRYGRNETERDLYEFYKYQAVSNELPTEGFRNSFAFLESIYEPLFSDELNELFAQQQKAKVMDRFDLTALLQAKLSREGRLTQRKKIYDERVIGRAKSTIETVPLRYPLILLDEVQNYLPQQIDIIRSCISPSTEAMLYTGDLAQQTSLFTIRKWTQVGEQFGDGRAIRLEKVYRSTLQILEYIHSLGFVTEIPEGIRKGEAVREYQTTGIASLHNQVKEVITENPEVLVGILGITPESIKDLHSLASKNIHVMTVAEAQGVEFDTVIFITQAIEMPPLAYPEAMRAEKARVLRDQVYVALTRAMNELYIFGSLPLKEALKS